MKLWCYAKPNAMIEHKFNDDVALCYADTKEEALIVFERLYILSIEDIFEPCFNDYGIAILTDY